jgi:hypothetical protein
MDQVVGQALATFGRIQATVPRGAANDDRRRKQATVVG